MFRNCSSCVSPHTRSATIVVKSPPRRLPGPPHPFPTELSWPVSTTQLRTEQRSSELCTHRAQTISSAALPTDRNHVVSGFANRLRYHVVSNCVSALVAGSTFVLNACLCLVVVCRWSSSWKLRRATHGLPCLGTGVPWVSLPGLTGVPQCPG